MTNHIKSSPIKAVLFDLGETLLNFGRVDTTRVFNQGARSTYAYLKQQQQPIGCYWMYFLKNFFSLRWHYLLSNILEKDFNAVSLLQRVNGKDGIQLNAQQWRHLSWLWYEPLSRLAQTESRLKQTLADLKALGLKLGILSNTFVHGSSLERHLDQLGWLDFFSVKLYSYEFDFRKPDIRIFKEAARCIGENIENILYVGDRINKDIIPTLHLGMYAALKRAYTNAGKTVPPGAWVIDQINELPLMIETINTSLVSNRPTLK